MTAAGPGLLLRGGTVVDGTGRERVRADIVVRGGRIDAIGEGLATPPDATIVDVGGLIVAPGFIDTHSHADFLLATHPGAEHSIRQGVTTEILGNCGFSPAPRSSMPERSAELTALVGGLGPDTNREWRGFHEYLAALDQARPRVNMAALVGHTTLRIAAMGTDDRPPTDDESTTMRDALRVALSDGAWGLSSGLVYPPGSWADQAELKALVSEVGLAGGVYASHIRDEGDGLLAAIDEAMVVVGESGVALQISHLKSVGGAPGRMETAIAVIEAARSRGLDVGFDAYPYTAGCTSLTQLLPPWVLDGGVEALLARISSPQVAERIRREIETGLPGWMDYARESWHRITFARIEAGGWQDAVGPSIAEVAAQRGQDPVDLVINVLLDAGGAALVITDLLEPSDVDLAVTHPLGTVGSDQVAAIPGQTGGHPRSHGTFARILGRMVRERGSLRLEDAVHKMSGLAATRFGLADRGRLEGGSIADIVVFDADRVIDQATYLEPTLHPLGIEHVLVDGRFAVHAGHVQSERLGRVLRRPIDGS